MKESIVLIGGGGHAKVIVDAIRASGVYNIIGICDSKQGKIYDIPIIGTDAILHNLYKQGVKNAFICVGAIGNLEKRWEIYNHLKEIGYNLPTIIHPTAILSPSVKVKEGTCIMAGTIINSDVSIGKMCILNTGSIVEHDCIVGENVHISPGTCLCGSVQIGAHTHIGAKAVINQGVKVGSGVVVGSGSVVIKDIENNKKVVGIPSREI